MHPLEQTPTNQAARRPDKQPVRIEATPGHIIATPDARAGRQPRAGTFGFRSEIHNQFSDARRIYCGEGSSIGYRDEAIVGLPKAAGQAVGQFTVVISPQEGEVGYSERRAMVQVGCKAKSTCQAIGYLSQGNQNSSNRVVQDIRVTDGIEDSRRWGRNVSTVLLSELVLRQVAVDQFHRLIPGANINDGIISENGIIGTLSVNRPSFTRCIYGCFQHESSRFSSGMRRAATAEQQPPNAPKRTLLSLQPHQAQPSLPPHKRPPDNPPSIHPISSSITRSRSRSFSVSW